jgi:pimeloyl-ACP methyl ester carboxylesterase
MTQSTVVLLHGFAGFTMMNRPMARMLKQAGYRPIDLGYDSWGLSLGEICERLSPRLTEIDDTCGTGDLHIVCHSMGGLVARALINLRRPKSLGHVVMLGTPNGGSEIADALDRQPLLRLVLGKSPPTLLTQRPEAIDRLLGEIDYSVGIVAGGRTVFPFGLSRLLPKPNDGKVSIASTRVEGAADHIVLPLPHMLLPYHRSVHRQVVYFLGQGRFLPDRRS